MGKCHGQVPSAQLIQAFYDKTSREACNGVLQVKYWFCDKVSPVSTMSSRVRDYGFSSRTSMSMNLAKRRSLVSGFFALVKPYAIT